MVRNFSVAWLAQSSHDSKHGKDPEPMETSQTPVRRHVPCVVQPRPPTFYDKVCIQLKLKCSQTDENTCPVDQKEKEGIVFTHSAQRNCTSPSSSSDNSGYSSGYESEAAASSIEDGSEGERDGGAPRRIRTKFTPKQIEKLEKIFNKHKYLDASERVKTAQSLNLSETQVRTWFQNRRMKLKREVQELRAEYTLPALSHILFPALPALPFHYSGQRVTFPAACHVSTPHVIAAVPVHQPLIPQPCHMIPMHHYY